VRRLALGVGTQSGADGPVRRGRYARRRYSGWHQGWIRRAVRTGRYAGRWLAGWTDEGWHAGRRYAGAHPEHVPTFASTPSAPQLAGSPRSPCLPNRRRRGRAAVGWWGRGGVL